MQLVVKVVYQFAKSETLAERWLWKQSWSGKPYLVEIIFDYLKGLLSFPPPIFPSYSLKFASFRKWQVKDICLNLVENQGLASSGMLVEFLQASLKLGQ